MTEKVGPCVTKDAAIERERRTLERSGRLRWFHWGIVALSLCVTLFAWQASRQAVEERAALRFEHAAEQVLEQFTERLKSYADLLRTGTGRLVPSAMSDGEWRRHVASLHFFGNFPADKGLGVMYRVPRMQLPDFLAHQREQRPGFALHPAHEQPAHLPVVNIYPESRAGVVIGLDLAHEPRRREAAMEALGQAAVRISAPIELAARGGTGFLMLAPFYREPTIDASGSLGGEPFAGAVIAPMRVEDLVSGTLDRAGRLVSVRISDAGEPLYDERNGALDRNTPDVDADGGTASLTRVVPLYGRQWRFDMTPTAVFAQGVESVVPQIILGGGLLLDVLLLGLFVLLSGANRRALSFATRAGAQLSAERETLAVAVGELGEANRTLETFACVASHDLKTPLNAIGFLADYIDEELDERSTGDGSGLVIREHVGRIHRQVRRAHGLIDGILDYSGIGEGDEIAETVDLNLIADDLRETLGVDAERLTTPAGLPTLITYRTRLEQVLSNLVGNAFKYHHEPATACVEVTAVRDGERYRFSVADNGPGIDPADHDRIFELFHTLDSSGEGTGVGLAIVQRTVELMGGTVTVTSVAGRGTTFTFDWPADVESEPVAGETSKRTADAPSARAA